MIKVIGIGNILLCDDGIGVKVTETLKKHLLSLGNDIEVIIGETNYLYCLENIKNDDFVIIIDSTFFQTHPGKITIFSFDECDEFLSISMSAHEDTLLKILRTEYSRIKGYLIGIEVSSLDYSLDLSPILKERFNSICNWVLNEIRNIIYKISG